MASGSGRIDLSWTPATDDVAVTGYDVVRDGVLLATTGAVTDYSDTAAAPATTYEYYVVARDGSGNASAPSAAATATTEPLTTRRTLTAEADARVEQANPAANFGSSALRTDSGADATVESHLRFSLSGLTGPVTSAKLRVYATTPSVDGPAVYGTPSGWDETSVSWDNRPARDTEALDDAGAVPDESWIELDVTAAVTGDGTYDFALAQPGGDGVDIRSRESLLAPQLVVETGDPPAPATSTSVPEADARVEQANPAANFGSSALRTDSGADATVESHLRFSLSGLTGPVTSAKLRVYATTPSVDGPAVYGTPSGWDETSVSWDNRPARDTEALDDAGAVPDESWIELDVTAAVTGDGTYDFALAQPGGDGVDIRSRESLLAPQLVVETSG